MPNRPAIPVVVQREVFTEAGHRCAVCGESLPLERAHIIPWSKSQDHSVENLICLCANCHSRADHEKWDPKTLQRYKAKPWVRHRFGQHNTTQEEYRSVEISIDLEITQFDETQRRWLRYALASFLNINPESIRITSVKEGSVKVSIELPSREAKFLIQAIANNDTLLSKFLNPLCLSTAPSQPGIQKTAKQHRVFIVHGHKDQVTHQAARFLEQLKLTPVLLREQPARGRTIIEAIEELSDVNFALVLLTQDDRGGRISAPSSKLLPRARQNVILELGYFLAKLGRNRVCVLYEENIELPSDYGGVLYVPLDDQGAWKFTMAKELKAAGVDVDVNSIL